MKTLSEHDTQNLIRISISENHLGTCFRANVGQAYTGDKIIKNPDRSIKIINPRPFNTGLPKGFSDLLVITPVIITPEMVGQQFARAGFLEIKTLTGRPTKDQLNFIDQMQKLGARAGVARSIEDVIQILC
jgi:hypothetical protein